MTITRIILPSDFGNDGPRDAEIVRQFLDYRDGKLFWLVNPSTGVKAGQEAGAVHLLGYGRLQIGGRFMTSHRIIWLMHYGEWPVDEIDHINGNRAENRIENLREVSHLENMRNLKISKANTSGTTGVGWKKKDKKWFACISLPQGMKYLGYFSNKDDAIAARRAAEKEYGFHPNHGRR